MLNVLMLMIGGAAGAVTRWSVAELWRRHVASLPTPASALVSLPWPTFAVNIIGSFLVGLFVPSLSYLGGNLSSVLYVLLVTGFCGGLSTLSSAAWEIIDLMRKGATVFSVSYILLSSGIALLALWLGLVIAS